MNVIANSHAGERGSVRHQRGRSSPQVWPVEAGTGTGSNGRAVFNDSTATLYLLYGTGATTTNYTVQIGPGGYYEFPATVMYLGPVEGVWSSATGNARTTAW